MSVPQVPLPARYSRPFREDRNTGRQLLEGGGEATLAEADGQWLAHGDDDHAWPIRSRGATPEGEDGIEVRLDQLNALPRWDATGPAPRWVGGPEPDDPSDVLENLRGRFRFRVAGQDGDEHGLRLPQAGALHAALAHWSTGSTEAATVVMPTGTGKTDTMVALFAHERPPLLLVLVPSDNLRRQIGEAFERLGVLRAEGLVAGSALNPVVGRVEHGFRSSVSATTFARRCNVMIATPSALGASEPASLRALLNAATHLFVDEAHHVAAATWRSVREAFVDKPVLQFTATPYRNDGEPLGGRLIYSFPLRRAQELGYFQSIRYSSVVALAEPDEAVAAEAVSRLRQDLDARLDHLVMARVKSIARARDEVLPIYQRLAPDLNPVALHSELPAAQRADAMRAIRSRESRVVVCVDMLGEGFDFPELKVAAFHDPHRSLGVALQFIGRFARTRTDLGLATAVVARPEAGYDPRLRALYAEDPDWNVVIELLATDAIAAVRELGDFDAGFGTQSREGLALQSLRPKMSTVVYRTQCANWSPGRITELFAAEHVVSPVSVNESERVAWIVVEDHSAVRWADTRAVIDVAHHLHVMHWDRDRKLLYINSSDLDSLHEDLAQRVCGETVQRITGEDIYRCLAPLQRAVPTNIGVLDLRNRSRRFSMHVGADVLEGFAVAEQQTKSNTNIFLVGYQDGERVTRGAAVKGRIWSQQAAPSILAWVRWARTLGGLLTDESLSLQSVMRSFVRPRPLEERPSLYPLAIDWPWLPYSGVGDGVRVRVGNSAEQHLLVDAQLVVTEHTISGPIPYEVRVGDVAVDYTAAVDNGSLVHRPVDREVDVLQDRRDPEPLSEYLNRVGATVWFESETVIEGPGLLLQLERGLPPIDTDLLVPIDWQGVDIKRESQGPQRDQGTVQARAAAYLAGLEDWDLLIDDDGTGEVADLVAIRMDDDEIVIHLVHCKYSSKPKPGGRVGDLYEVCGQAHRSAHFRQSLDAMVKNLIRRERDRQSKGITGLMIGTGAVLLQVQDVVRMRRPRMHISIAQPGFSISSGEPRHFEILGCADTYVREIAHASFHVWCSA